MDHLKILKRSWQTLWHYRALWIFGIILAITAASSGGSSGGGQLQYNLNGTDIDRFSNRIDMDLPEIFHGNMDSFGNAMIAIIIAVICFFIILSIVMTVLRYIANTALIRMVDDYENTEEFCKVGDGFRLGWSRYTWRIFLIDLVIGIPQAIVYLLLAALALSPLLLWLTDNRVAAILGTVAAVGLFFLVMLLIILASTVFRVLSQYFHRVCALQDAGVFESIRVGFRLARRNLGDTALMWLILLGLQIAYTIVTMVIGFMLLIPAFVLGGGVVLLAAGIGLLIGQNAVLWILAALIGLPLFILIFVLPLTFLEGLKEVYLSNAWTLAYRELAARNGTTPEETQPDEPAGEEPALGQEPLAEENEPQE